MITNLNCKFSIVTWKYLYRRTVIRVFQDSWELGQSDTSWKSRNTETLDKMLSKDHNTNKTLERECIAQFSTEPNIEALPNHQLTRNILTPTDSELDNMYRLLDVELRPLTPDYNSQLSQDIFQQHKQLAQEYLKVQTEIALLGQHKSETLESLSTDALNQFELQKLQDEKVGLIGNSTLLLDRLRKSMRFGNFLFNLE